MYNNIGLRTARGSGTNGYIERNLAHLSAPQQEFVVGLKRKKKKQLSTQHPKKLKADGSILEHEKKRKIEILITNERDKLEDAGLSDDEIKERLSEMRKRLMQSNNNSHNYPCTKSEVGGAGGPGASATAAKIAKNESLLDALGLTEMEDGTLKSKYEERRLQRLEAMKNKNELEQKEEMLNREKYHPLDHRRLKQKAKSNDKNESNESSDSSECDTDSDKNENNKDKGKDRNDSSDSSDSDSDNESDVDSSSVSIDDEFAKQLYAKRLLHENVKNKSKSKEKEKEFEKEKKKEDFKDNNSKQERKHDKHYHSRHRSRSRSSSRSRSRSRSRTRSRSRSPSRSNRWRPSQHRRSSHRDSHHTSRHDSRSRQYRRPKC